MAAADLGREPELVLTAVVWRARREKLRELDIRAPVTPIDLVRRGAVLLLTAGIVVGLWGLRLENDLLRNGGLAAFVVGTLLVVMAVPVRGTTPVGQARERTETPA